MKKQAEKSGFGAMIASFLDVVLGSVKDYVISGITETLDGVFDKVEERILGLQRKLMQQLIIKLFLLLGLLCLVASLAFYMIDVMHWQPFIILLVIGALFLVFASVSANMWRR